MWPFDECHYYKARICKLQYTENFPSKNILQSIKMIETVQPPKPGKRRKTQEPRPLIQTSSGVKPELHFYDYDPYSLECKINRKNEQWKETQKCVSESNLTIDQKDELAMISHQYDLLKDELKSSKI